MICEKCEALSALIDGYRRERDEAQARVIDAALIHADLVRERDEALALNAEWAEKAATWIASPEAAQRLDGYRNLGQQVAEAQRERDEARAELSTLRKDYDSVLEANVGLLDDAPWADVRRAYIRGAEAMRAAAVNALHMAGHGTLCDTSECEHWGRYVRALPIPEEP